MGDFTPRPTTYNGVRMRSRLEALFAQHCDQCNLTWEYEPGCFADQTGQYLPDFKITAGPDHAYVEVKPTEEGADYALRESMPRIWSSDPDATLASVFPNRKSHLESPRWRFYVCEPAAPKSWERIAANYISAMTTFDISDDGYSMQVWEDGPRFDGIIIHLIFNMDFEEAWQRHERGQNGPWKNGSPIAWIGGDVWEMVGARVPDSLWSPRLISVKDGIVEDTYIGQYFINSPVVDSFLALREIPHIYSTQQPMKGSHT